MNPPKTTAVSRPDRLGTHVLLDLEGCDRARIDDVSWVREAMVNAARLAGATVVTEVFHRFSPQGVSGVVVITESHLAVHTWPEFGAVAVDLFTCGGTIRAELAADSLARAFGASHSQVRTVDRSESPRAVAPRPERSQELPMELAVELPMERPDSVGPRLFSTSASGPRVRPEKTL